MTPRTCSASRRAAALALCVSASALAFLGVPSLGSAAAEFALFKTPSGNIICAYNGPMQGVPAGVRCDMASGLKPRPRRPAGCTLDFGQGLTLVAGRGGRVTCAGDTLLGSPAAVLAYGRRFSGRGITCVSRFSGLTCKSNDGHGFFLSRQDWRLF